MCSPLKRLLWVCKFVLNFSDCPLTVNDSFNMQFCAKNPFKTLFILSGKFVTTERVPPLGLLCPVDRWMVLVVVSRVRAK